MTRDDIHRSSVRPGNPETIQTLQKDLDALAVSENYLSFQFSQIENFIGNRVLEIGAGIGNHTQRILTRGPDVLFTLERDPRFCDILKRRFGDKITTLQTDLEKLRCDLPFLRKAGINTIVGMNVLEHIEGDLECLRGLSTVLVPGGRIILVLPAFHMLYSKLDSAYGHFRRYSKSRMLEYSESLNMSIVANSYFNSIGWLAWFFGACLTSRTHIHGNGLRMLDTIFPLLAVLESRMPFLPFGLSLLCVLQK